MKSRTFSFASGTVLLIASFFFILMAFFLNLDAFIPVMMSIASFITGIAFFFMGQGARDWQGVHLLWWDRGKLCYACAEKRRHPYPATNPHNGWEQKRVHRGTGSEQVYQEMEDRQHRKPDFDLDPIHHFVQQRGWMQSDNRPFWLII